MVKSTHYSLERPEFGRMILNALTPAPEGSDVFLKNVYTCTHACAYTHTLKNKNHKICVIDRLSLRM